MFNTAYIDINTLYYSVFINHHHSNVHYTQTFLLGAAVLKWRSDRNGHLVANLWDTGESLDERDRRSTLTVVGDSHPVRWHTDSGVRDSSLSY